MKENLIHQIFFDLLINSAFEQIFNVMQLILVKLSGILSKKYFVMIRLFVITLSYLSIDKLLQIKFVKKFAELK
jgi:hypothetical protein